MATNVWKVAEAIVEYRMVVAMPDPISRTCTRGDAKVVLYRLHSTDAKR
jgi:hypothetical protein